jgi:CheY-like chemotaxis protein/HPt (histidine-containing phosphotransfer) domain-containing protein
MTSSRKSSAFNRDRLAQLRHDLLNPINVLEGATTALLGTELTDSQRAWVRMLRSTTDRLLEIVRAIEDAEAHDPPMLEGRARLADLLSIAAARVGKPFDREALVAAIQRVAGRRHLKILLVDDSPELVLLVRTFLRDTNWDLDVVENGERAVAQATTERYDVVLMDIDLPGLDGATAAHAIRAADLARGTSPTPVIAMTAFDQRPPERWSEPPASGPEASDVVVIDDPEIEALIPDFLENRRADVRVFNDALGAGEFGHIQSAAHKMKGSGRGYGFEVVSRLGDELELAAHQQDVSGVRRLIDELDAYLTRVRVVTR